MAEPRRPAEGCSCRNTDCVERPLRRLFEGLGSGVAACPWPFVLVPLLLSGGLGAGFLFLPQRQANDIEEQFTPTQGPAKAERAFVRRYFPTDDSERFSVPRLPTEGAYATLIAVAARGDSVLSPPAWRDVRRLDAAVRARGGYERLCARSAGACASPNPLLDGGAGADLENLTFPFNRSEFLGAALGGVQTDPGGRVLAARALKLVYYLQEDGPAAAESRRWLESFLREFPSQLAALDFTSVQVTRGPPSPQVPGLPRRRRGRGTGDAGRWRGKAGTACRLRWCRHGVGRCLCVRVKTEEEECKSFIFSFLVALTTGDLLYLAVQTTGV